MADHANGQERVTSSRHRLHQTWGLQDIMADSDIRNVSKRAYFVVKYKIPTKDNELFDGSKHGWNSPMIEN